MSDALVTIRDLKVHFPLSMGTVKAVDGVSFDVMKGETLGIVGESGCGKSTLGKAIIQLIRPTAGSVVFDGVDLTKQWKQGLGFGSWNTTSKMRSLRKRMQIVFQDPYASLNPRMTVEDIISEPLRTFGAHKDKKLRHEVQALMERVGLDPRYVRRYPHEFSGGQRQRIGIARAIALSPDLIIADEPISALDVSIQAQVLNLLKELQKDLNLTYVFIAHDLAAVRHISDRVAVMYLGKVAEIGSVTDIIEKPQHPYTKALISAIPIPDPKVELKRERTVLEGDVPSPIHPPSGCRFNTRCPIAEAKCKEEVPQLRNAQGRDVACHLV